MSWFPLEKAIAGLRANDEKLLELDFFSGYRYIGNERAKELADALATNSTLEQLRLCYNAIGDEGAKALAGALATNNTLKKLNLNMNRIGDEGAKGLADALATNNTLKELNLGRNGIGNEGAKSLAVALTTNNTLEQLSLYNLNHNYIGDEGAKALAGALASNNTLKHLNLDGNDIKCGETRAQIQFFLRLNRKGRNIVFTPTPVPLSAWAKVAAEPPGILYYLLRTRAGLLVATGHKRHKHSDGTAGVSRQMVLREK